ncbi:hypothetical protein UVI_02055430 [Ustilaginoidea virens]|uniref:Uncharacterized protein n=1 Tax=Ustilaginoidea virens TaxID=1159556 RepID=A0A1B5KTZ0_USTVR|nr:hypothetical protein UVI_02055430 [Ustilaginoidea virens]
MHINIKRSGSVYKSHAHCIDSRYGFFLSAAAFSSLLDGRRSLAIADMDGCFEELLCRCAQDLEFPNAYRTVPNGIYCSQRQSNATLEAVIPSSQAVLHKIVSKHLKSCHNSRNTEAVAGAAQRQQLEKFDKLHKDMTPQQKDLPLRTWADRSPGKQSQAKI